MACTLAALAGSDAAHAHDSWLAPAPAGTTSATSLHFTTGNRYPRGESAPSPATLGTSGCVDGKGKVHALRPLASRDPSALHLRSPARGPVACWASLKAHEITLDSKLIDVYFREIRPPDSVRLAYAAHAERGVGWHETYSKFARIEGGGGRIAPEALRKLRAPVGMPLEVVLLGSEAPRAGQAVDLRVLAQGQPVAGLSLELVSERNPLGVWGKSDADGKLSFVLPFGGAWLVRGTLVEAGAAEGRWVSRFVTLAFAAK
jgi:hypothetical protein